MNRVAIYCRLSDEDKLKETNQDSESIQNQKNILMEYAIGQGWEIYKLYSDDDWSGMDSERPEWNQMLLDAKAKQFNIILCKSQSRFTRDMEIVERYLHTLFPMWGIRFVGFADNADTDNKGNKKARQINGLVNEWYCEDISENIKVVFDKKRRDGYYIGGLGPYGLMKDPQLKGKLIIDPEAALIVKQIFQLYLEGNGTWKIAKRLNEEGIPNPTKYKNLHGLNWKKGSQEEVLGLWTNVTVRRILKNQMYVGDMVQGLHKKVSYKSKKCISVPKEEWFIVENTHEAIVSRETFDLVQKMMNRNRRSDGTGSPHPLAGKVKCADCGSTMNRFTPNGRKGTPLPYKYLKCSLTTKKKGECTGHYIRLDQLEMLILERFQAYFKHISEETLQGQCTGYFNNDRAIKAFEKQLADTDKEIAQNEKIIETLYLDRVNGDITVQKWIEMNTNFEIKLKRLFERRAKIEQEIQSETSYKSKEIILCKKIETYKNLETLNAKVVNEFIETITIGEKDRETGVQEIKLIWRY